MTADAIRFWTRAAALTTIVGLVLSLAFPSYMSIGYEPLPAEDPTWLLVIAVSVALAVALLWRSRVGAVIALVGTGSVPFARWMWADLWPWLPVDAVLIVVYARAFEATLSHHAAKAPASRFSRSVRRAAQVAGVVVLVIAMWLLGTMPPLQVVSGRQLPRTYQRALDETGLLDTSTGMSIASK